MAKPQRYAAAFDSHGDQADPSATRAFWEFCRYWKPTIRIAGGDHFDFRHLRAKAGEGERYESAQHDFDCGLNFLRKFKPTHVCWGNHDDRVWQQLSHPNQNVVDAATRAVEEIEDAVKGAKVIPYDKRQFIQIGDLKIIHGFATGPGAGRRTATVYGRVLMGHNHHKEIASVEGIEEHTCFVSGCLCRLDMPYNARNLASLRHSHGWAYGVAYPNGHTTCYLASNVKGVWHLPTEFVTIDVRKHG